MSKKPMDPKTYNALSSYRNQLQHMNTTQALLDQKRASLQQQQATGADPSLIQQTQADIAKLEKMLAQQQNKLQTAEKSSVLQDVIKETTVDYTEESLANKTDSGTINKTEMLRKKEGSKSQYRAISERRFQQLTTSARKKGAIILRGSVEVEQHLEDQGAFAATIGDVLMFRKDASLTDVLEETYHFQQNLEHINDDKGEPLRTILNEIDAKEYLIRVAKQYRIPRNELDHIKNQLESYKRQLERIKKGD